MKKLIIIFVAILLIACAAPSPQVTVTSDVTAILTTQTSTATPMTEAPTNFPPPTLAVTPEKVIVPEDQQTLSIEADSHVVCSFEDTQVENSWFRKAIQKAVDEVIFDDLVVSPGWEEEFGHTDASFPIQIAGKSVNQMSKLERLISVCYIPGDKFGHPEKELAVATFAELNKDRSKSSFSIVADSEDISYYLEGFKNHEFALGINGWFSEDRLKQIREMEFRSWFTDKLLEMQGGKDKLKQISQTVADNDTFSPEASRILWFPVPIH